MKVILFCLSLLWLLPVRAENIGVIVTTIGPADWFRDGQSLRLGRGDALVAGDKVVTGTDTRLVLRMNEGSLITLGAGTSLQFTDWHYSKGRSDNAARLDMAEGFFRFVTGLITQQDHPDLTVATPSGTIGIRGTDFWGGYLDATTLDVVLLAGSHRLEISNDYGAVFISSPGDGVSVVAGEKPAAPVTWGREKLQRALQSVALPDTAL